MVRTVRPRLSRKKRIRRAEAFKAALSGGAKVLNTDPNTVPRRPSPVSCAGLLPEIKDTIRAAFPGCSVSVLWSDRYCIRFETDSPSYVERMGFPFAGLKPSTDIVGITLLKSHKKNPSALSLGIKSLGGRMNNNRTPQEELERCRQELATALASSADPRTVGLWRSKLEKAEAVIEEEARYSHSLADSESTLLDGDEGDAESDDEGEDVPSGGGDTADDIPVPEPVVAKAQIRSLPRSRSTTPSGEGLGPCLCGCGSVATKGRNFRPGHDARFASYVKRLDAGKVQLLDLPELVQRLVAENHDAIARARKH